MNAPTEDAVREALREVMDPEIPTCSIVDLGIIYAVTVADGTVEVELLPTFSGCPALDVIREDVERALQALAPETRHHVKYVMSEPWTVDRITPEGLEALRSYGISAPPAPAPVIVQVGRAPQQTPCPYCGALSTQQESPFGPTPCRTTRYCPTCKNPFEGFKPKR